MIYLIVQMIVALGLAAICGGAIGWLVHRATHTKHVQKLRHSLGRQQNQLAQAQSEIGMLTDDYEELQRRSQDEIDSLRQDNEQIPFLNNNLEKSQLLVRQMMQKHEAKIRDITTENQALSAKLKTVEDREQAYNKVQAELDRVRRKKTASPTNDASNEAHVTDPQLNVDFADQPEHDAVIEATLAEAPGAVDSDALPDDAKTTQTPDTTSAENAKEANASSPTSAGISDARSSGSWASAPLVSTFNELASDTPQTVSLNADAGTIDDDLNDEPESDESDTEGDPFDHVMEVGDELQRELDIDADDDLLLDGSTDSSALFEPVEHRDDLKQIFGIGPVTEKALNELGITSYSQLADLKGHDIEKIANALEIVPGRIERDDWVGNARRQLEDVLEQL